VREEPSAHLVWETGRVLSQSHQLVFNPFFPRGYPEERQEHPGRSPERDDQEFRRRRCFVLRGDGVVISAAVTGPRQQARGAFPRPGAPARGSRSIMWTTDSIAVCVSPSTGTSDLQARANDPRHPEGRGTGRWRAMTKMIEPSKRRTRRTSVFALAAHCDTGRSQPASAEGFSSLTLTTVDHKWPNGDAGGDTKFSSFLHFNRIASNHRSRCLGRDESVLGPSVGVYKTCPNSPVRAVSLDQPLDDSRRRGISFFFFSIVQWEHGRQTGGQLVWFYLSGAEDTHG